MTVSIAFNLTLLNVVAMLVIALLAYVLFIKYQKRNRDRAMALIRSQILAFFGAAGIQVEVACFTSDNTRKFTVCIDSQAVKKFKFSNVVEMVLIRYLARTTGIPVERIYWRFSMPAENEGAMLSPIDTMATEGIGFKGNFGEEEFPEDAYKVAETSWDNFERALQREEAEREAKKDVQKKTETIT